MFFINIARANTCTLPGVANKRKLVLCMECEQLKIRRLSLGRQYSKALARAFDARDTTRYAELAEAADVLHTQFKQIQAEINNHRTVQHRRVISPASALGQPQTAGSDSSGSGPFVGPCDNAVIENYLVDRINPVSSAERG